MVAGSIALAFEVVKWWVGGGMALRGTVLLMGGGGRGNAFSRKI